MNLLKTFRHKKDGRLLKIYFDDSGDSPREWDNLGVMLCKHSSYSLGDEENLSFDGSFEEFRDYLVKERGAVVILPLYLYDHSGISISTSFAYPYNCRWDSSRVGYIFVSAKRIRDEYGVKRISKKLKDKVKSILESEVKTYDQFLRGDVYGFNLVSPVVCESCGHVEEDFLDSCWGFYGDDFVANGLFETAGVVVGDWVEVEE